MKGPILYANRKLQLLQFQMRQPDTRTEDEAFKASSTMCVECHTLEWNPDPVFNGTFSMMYTLGLCLACDAICEYIEGHGVPGKE